MYSIEGQCLHSYEPFEQLEHLGLRLVSFPSPPLSSLASSLQSLAAPSSSSSASLMALAGYDGEVSLINHQTWKAVWTFVHPHSINPNDVVSSCRQNYFPYLFYFKERCNQNGSSLCFKKIILYFVLF